jgi:hypothetical protein
MALPIIDWSRIKLAFAKAVPAEILLARDLIAGVAGEFPYAALATRAHRTTFKPRAGYCTFGLIWAVHLSILLQTPLNNDVLKFLRTEPASF